MASSTQSPHDLPPHYAVALGSNRAGAHGRPADEVRAALAALGAIGRVVASPIVASAPLGPSIRRFANAVALVETDASPPDLLARLKAIERRFGRRRGRRWGARVLDLDIVLWSGGRWRSAGLAVPHVAYRERRFVLDPLADLAPRRRDPGPGSTAGLTIRQLARRLTARRPAPRPRGRVGL
ncbi:MAG: 2-amino-4-hydroxy-6-hydroxymethyldihydropteridine diphosphokinase [Janthinobacterium lividum]